MRKIYTGIGSRQTPPDVLAQMQLIGEDLAKYGWILRSGHAHGADQAFEYGAFRSRGEREIYLPWEGFNGGTTYISSYIIPDPDTWKIAEQLAAEYHPNWPACNFYARKLHTRNVFQVLGKDLQTPSDFVVCWTKGGQRKGGTGQALRIAEAQGIPIFDLAICSVDDVVAYINEQLES